MRCDLLITNGLVVDSEGSCRTDLAVKDGRIMALGANLPLEADRVLEADGRFVLPGVIDTHVHIEEPFQGLTPLEDWAAGSRNAALGGVTTVLNFSIQDPGRSLMAKIQEHRERISSLSCVDFNFHGVFTDYTDLDKVRAEVGQLFAAGVTSLKAFMIYTGDGLYADDWALYNLLLEIKKYGGFLGVHAENMPIGENLQRQMAQQGRTSAGDWPLSKPNFVEAEAVQRACLLAQVTGGNLYIVHTSTRESMDIIEAYRRKKAPVYSETCPHYLLFDASIHDLPGVGVWQIISPPLRSKEDQAALWEGIRRGTVQIIGSDHNAYHKEPKDQGYAESGFPGVSNGGPGILEGLSVLYSEGVAQGRLSLERLVEITSANPAKMFGLYPRKGCLRPGSDADLVIFDPTKKQRLGADLYQSMDWTVYEGLEVTGFPSHTLVRGEFIVDDGHFKGRPGYGRFIPGRMNSALIGGIR